MIWDMLVFALGVVAFVLVFHLLSIPEWIESYVKRRRPRRQLEREVAELSRRVQELEARHKP